MLSKKIDSPINENDPWDGDKLRRKDFAEILCNYIRNTTQPFVVALTSSYGTGKTDFLTRLKHHIQHTDQFTETVMINAWETDYMDHPLTAFINAIQRIKKIKPETEDAIKVLKKNVPVIIFNVFKAVVCGFIETHIGKDGTKAIKDAAGAFAGGLSDLGDAYFNAIQTETDAITEFKKALGDLIETLPNNRLLIIVDELDRCRPDYAIKLLEVIKHFFHIKGIFFILSVDGQQLESAVKTMYGSTIDAAAYLKKFIDWQLSLPTPDAKTYILYLTEDVFELDDFFAPYEGEGFSQKPEERKIVSYWHSQKLFIESMHMYFEKSETPPSLRDLDKTFTNIDIFLKATHRKDKEGLERFYAFSHWLAIISISSVVNKNFKQFYRQNHFGDSDLKRFLILQHVNWDKEKVSMNTLRTLSANFKKSDAGDINSQMGAVAQEHYNAIDLRNDIFNKLPNDKSFLQYFYETINLMQTAAE
jgi:hypothetical protein